MTVPQNPFAAIFDSPAYLARQAERERARTERRTAFLAGHGDESAVWIATPMEDALRAACAPLASPEDAARGLDCLAGWCPSDGFDHMPAALCDAVTGAWPPPASVAEAWAEFQDTQTRTADRQAFAEGYEAPAFLEARQRIVEEVLNAYPARGLDDIRARLDWLEHQNERGAPRIEVQRERLATLRADIERIMRP